MKQRILTDVKNIIPTYDPTDATIQTNIQSKTAQEVYEGVPFKYEREAAGQLAIIRSQDNFEEKNPDNQYYFRTGSGDIKTGVPAGVSPGPDTIATDRLRYTTLNHKTGEQTGSAYFISEMIHFDGKVLMSVYDSDASDYHPDALEEVINMWLARCGHAPNLEATSSWSDHRFLMDYFVEEHRCSELSTDGSDLATQLLDTIFWRHPDNVASLTNAGVLDQYSSLPFDDTRFVADDLNRYVDFRDSVGTGGDWKSSEAQEAGSTYLIGRFSEDRLANITWVL